MVASQDHRYFRRSREFQKQENCLKTRGQGYWKGLSTGIDANSIGVDEAIVLAQGNPG